MMIRFGSQVAKSEPVDFSQFFAPEIRVGGELRQKNNN